MIQMDMPHINILSKIDKVADYDELPFNLDYYTDVDDLTYLTPHLETESPALRSEKFGKRVIRSRDGASDMSKTRRA